eukprot:116721-Amorphochlora_amoeboformis.AAC.1
MNRRNIWVPEEEGKRSTTAHTYVSIVVRHNPSGQQPTLDNNTAVLPDFIAYYHITGVSERCTNNIY